MSELITTNGNRATIRLRLLTGVSALALTAYVSTASTVKAEDADRPTVWIELGGQMEHISGQGKVFAPGFLAANPTSSVLWHGETPLDAQVPPKFSFGENGKISIQPKGFDWVFSAAVRIGRSSYARDVQHQTNGVHEVTKSGVLVTAAHLFRTENFAETQTSFRENHTVLDFSAGHDVGLGLFGRDASSQLSLGVRFAQFTSSAAFDIRARPDLAAKYFYEGPFKIPLLHFHTYHVTDNAVREFRGVGPMLSWTASAPVAGNPQDGELALDWGVNAALLFGRQKAHVRHQETANYHTPAAHYFNQDHYTAVYHYPSVNHPTAGHEINRSIAVPNVGGSIGLSWRVQDFKVSMGYRADFFLNGVDVGIDKRMSSTLGFYGPFASISLGLGG